MESEFSRVIDALPGLVWTARPDGGIDFLNQRWRDYTGLTTAQALGHGWRAAIHPDDLPALLESWRSIIASEAPGEAVARMRRVDGDYRHFLFRATPVRDAAGRVTGWCGMNTDIEDRRRAEEALRQHEHQFRAEAEDLLAGEKRLLEMVASGRPLPDVLDELCRVFEALARDCTCSVVLVDATGAALRQGASPSLPAPFMASIDGRPVGLETGPCAMASYLNAQVIVADVKAETRWKAYGWPDLALSYGLQAVWSTPIASRSGKVLGSFALHYHLPSTPSPQHQTLIERFTHLAAIAIERAQGEEALKRSEACLAEAQMLSRTGSFGWSVSIDRHFWSDETFRIFEYDPAIPATIQLVLDRAHPEDRPLVERAMALGAEGRNFDYECRFVMPSGGLKHLHIVAHATRDPDGALDYIGAVQDVTERRLSEEALAKIRSDLSHVTRVVSLGALTASIAHEINQPLSGIITNASTCLRMLAAEPPNVVGALETARRTIRDGNRAADVITRLRALLGRKDVTTEPVDLNEATREVIALSERELRRGQVMLRTAFADDLPPALGDRVQLQQVILNLLLNATEAMGEVDDRPRSVVIKTLRDDGDRVRLVVEDAGAGFHPDDAERLFQAFYTTKPRGMGIGLSVSRSIIESHRGRLWAAPNDGPGARFSFSIPRVPEAVTVARHPGVQTSAEADAGQVERIS